MHFGPKAYPPPSAYTNFQDGGVTDTSWVPGPSTATDDTSRDSTSKTDLVPPSTRQTRNSRNKTASSSPSTSDPLSLPPRTRRPYAKSSSRRSSLPTSLSASTRSETPSASSAQTLATGSHSAKSPTSHLDSPNSNSSTALSQEISASTVQNSRHSTSPQNSQLAPPLISIKSVGDLLNASAIPPPLTAPPDMPVLCAARSEQNSTSKADFQAILDAYVQQYFTPTHDNDFYRLYIRGKMDVARDPSFESMLDEANARIAEMTRDRQQRAGEIAELGDGRDAAGTKRLSNSAGAKRARLSSTENEADIQMHTVSSTSENVAPSRDSNPSSQATSLLNVRLGDARGVPTNEPTDSIKASSVDDEDIICLSDDDDDVIMCEEDQTVKDETKEDEDIKVVDHKLSSSWTIRAFKDVVIHVVLIVEEPVPRVIGEPRCERYTEPPEDREEDDLEIIEDDSKDGKGVSFSMKKVASPKSMSLGPTAASSALHRRAAQAPRDRTSYCTIVDTESTSTDELPVRGNDVLEDSNEPGLRGLRPVITSVRTVSMAEILDCESDQVVPPLAIPCGETLHVTGGAVMAPSAESGGAERPPSVHPPAQVTCSVRASSQTSNTVYLCAQTGRLYSDTSNSVGPSPRTSHSVQPSSQSSKSVTVQNQSSDSVTPQNRSSNSGAQTNAMNVYNQQIGIPLESCSSDTKLRSALESNRPRSTVAVRSVYNAAVSPANGKVAVPSANNGVGLLPVKIVARPPLNSTGILPVDTASPAVDNITVPSANNNVATPPVTNDKTAQPIFVSISDDDDDDLIILS